MPSPSEIERQDQENGATAPEPTLEERFRSAMKSVADAFIEVAHLERQLAASRAQLKKVEADSAALLAELTGEPGRGGRATFEVKIPDWKEGDWINYPTRYRVVKIRPRGPDEILPLNPYSSPARHSG